MNNLREDAISDLRILFGIKNPTEEDINYLVKLKSSGEDIVGLAIGGLPPDECDPSFPKEPGEDVMESDLVANGYHRNRNDK